MVYSVEWHPESENELRQMFTPDSQRQLIRKVLFIAAGIPQSLELKTVSRLRGTHVPSTAQGAYELRIGSGYRAAFWLFPEEERLLVYLVGTHDYANRRFMSASRNRGDSE